jgi:hypothetical protein
MDENLLKFGKGNLENRSQEKKTESTEASGTELKAIARQNLEGINAIEESVAESAVPSENEKKAVGEQGGAASTATRVQQGASVSAMPPIEEMIQQTVAAIEVELQKTTDEMKLLLKNKASTPYLINDKVRRIRFLNSLISELHRAAKVAEEFVVGLWKQYVRKVN